MSDIKLFMFQSGIQQCKYQHIRMNQGAGESYEIPVPWFLLTHPDGFALIDGGLAVEGLKDPHAYWGSAVELFKPVMSAEQGCVEQLKKIGIALRKSATCWCPICTRIILARLVASQMPLM